MDGSAADLAIRMRRAAFNRALALGDPVAIGPLLAPAVVLVSGSDSAVLAGRTAQLQAWKREFAVPAERRNRYVRTPDRIVASAVEPLAMEHGHWTCAVAGVLTCSGTYAAKWRLVRADWVIEAELFVTLA